MTHRQQKALQGLLRCPTKRAAAEYAGISESTMRNYLADPAFMTAYQDEITNLLDDATREAQQSISPALGVLREISTDPEAPAAVRVQASRGIIEYSLKLTEQIDTLRKVADLERAIIEIEGGKR